MYQYYIFIATKTQDGEYAHDVKWAWDADRTAAIAKAESLYYSCLSTAAVSTYAMHSVTLISDKGEYMMSRCFTHPPVPEEV